MNLETVFELLKKCLTRDNLTFILAILGSAGAFYNWLTNYLNSRKSLQIQIERICKFESSIVAYITILNRSSASISISGVSLKVDGKLYPGYHVPLRTIRIKHYEDGNAIADREIITMAFPANLGGLSGVSGYLMFDIPPALSEKLEAPLIFLISSNRGRPLQMSLSFSQWDKWSAML